MRKFAAFLYLAGLLAAAPVLLADDLTAVTQACGKPATLETRRDAGAWVRTVEYHQGGTSVVDITFTSQRQAGPWKYSQAFHFGGEAGLLQRAVDVLPCLLASSVVPEPAPVSTASVPVYDHSDDGVIVFSFFFVPLGVIAYIFPSIVAARRDCKAGAGILVLNLFLGWTFIGWVVALIWAAAGETKRAAGRQLTAEELQLAAQILSKAASNTPTAR